MGYTPCIVAIFGHFQNALKFFNISCFFDRFFALNNLIVFLETFFECFYFLTQTEYFAWAIAFVLWPFLVIFKMLSFFEY